MTLLPCQWLGCLKSDESAVAPSQMANCANLLDNNGGIHPDKRSVPIGTARAR